MSIISKNIRYLRNLIGKTQQEMAFDTEIEKHNIGAYEEGRSEPNIKTLIKLSDYFNVSIDDMVRKELTNQC